MFAKTIVSTNLHAATDMHFVDLHGRAIVVPAGATYDYYHSDVRSEILVLWHSSNSGGRFLMDLDQAQAHFDRVMAAVAM